MISSSVMAGASARYIELFQVAQGLYGLCVESISLK